MPYETIDGVAIRYQVLGEAGPWVALSPGGRRGLEGVEPLARRVADAGYRVLIHDRRNCGASDVAIEGADSEYEIWADDLHVLLQRLGGLPAVVGGASSGCRLAILFALRHPEAVRALLLWRVTGGNLAASRLAETYYGEYMAAARAGGMAAVCRTEHFAERIAERPSNRDRLMAMDVNDFVAQMAHWRTYFLAGADLPVIGASETDLASIAVPTCIIPGNDGTHRRSVAEAAHRLIPKSELHDIMGPELDMDLGPIEDWQAKDGEIAAVFTDFLSRELAPAA